MNAADVLAEARRWYLHHRNEPETLHADFQTALAYHQEAVLLAHGEQGVAILPDGTLWALETEESTRYYFDGTPSDTATTYRLVPLSAEAGDTDG